LKTNSICEREVKCGKGSNAVHSSLAATWINDGISSRVPFQYQLFSCVQIVSSRSSIFPSSNMFAIILPRLPVVFSHFLLFLHLSLCPADQLHLSCPHFPYLLQYPVCIIVIPYIHQHVFPIILSLPSAISPVFPSVPLVPVIFPSDPHCYPFSPIFLHPPPIFTSHPNSFPFAHSLSPSCTISCHLLFQSTNNLPNFPLYPPSLLIFITSSRSPFVVYRRRHLQAHIRHY